MFQTYSKLKMKQKAVETLEKCLRTYDNCGYTHANSPQTIWKVHDYLGQACSGINNGEKEREHYNEAIRILTDMGGAPPEVKTVRLQYKYLISIFKTVVISVSIATRSHAQQCG